MTIIRSESAKANERARAARQFADQCKQRAATLVSQACLLLERFDELELRMLIDRRRAHESKAAVSGAMRAERPQ